MNDLRGIEQKVNLNWNSKEIPFNSGVTSNNLVNSGINAVVDINAATSSSCNFALDLDLKGSQLLYFTPVGKVTDVKLNSKRTNPSFNGAFLPDNRTVTNKGFKADWNILHLNRNFPQIWKGIPTH
ncbi:MAG: inner membrane CreD family protein [Solirubrobacteraceae bacterium]